MSLQGLVHVFLSIVFLSVFTPISARAETQPRHWTLMFETMRAIRDTLESVELGEAVTPEQIRKIAEDVQVVIRRPQDVQPLVDHLLGNGRTDAGPLIKDYQAITLRVGAGKHKELLERLGFPQLVDSIGISRTPGPARDYFLKRLGAEMQRVKAMQGPMENVFSAQNKLKTGTRVMEHAAFITMMLAGLAVGDLAFQAAPYMGLRNLPLERVAAAIGAGVATTVGGFNTVWPWIQDKFSFVFLHGRYKRLRTATKQMLEFDQDSAIPRVAELAKATGSVIQAQEDAALDALLLHKTPESTEALLDVAIDDLEKGFPKRADRILKEIEDRHPGAEMAKLATAARAAIAQKKSFEKSLGKVKRRYAARNLWLSTSILAAALGGVAFMEPQTLSFTQALVFHGIGFAGARALFYRLWPGMPEAKMKDKLTESNAKLVETLTEMLRAGRNASPPKQRGAFDPRQFSIDMVVALARYHNLGDQGKFVRHAAREALHQFDDDVAMMFLIMEAQNRILSEAVNRREPTDKVRDVVNQMISHTTDCLAQFQGLK